MLPNGAVERIAGEYERAWSESANGHAGAAGGHTGPRCGFEGVWARDMMEGAGNRVHCLGALLLQCADGPHELEREDMAEIADILLSESDRLRAAALALRRVELGRSEKAEAV